LPVRELLEGGYELDDDAARIDLDAVHRFLAEEAWWARGRPREVVERHLLEAAVVAGLYGPTGEQVGYCRIVSDLTIVAYVADVWIEPDDRGLGRGLALVRFAVDHPRLADVLTTLLHTRDTHGLYEQLGFVRPLEDERLMQRRRRLP
jgi:ribosomal protein S18 acetylase RimI-like enzyme